MKLGINVQHQINNILLTLDKLRSKFKVKNIILKSIIDIADVCTVMSALWLCKFYLV